MAGGLDELARPVADPIWLLELDAARFDTPGDTGAPIVVVDTLLFASRPFTTDAVLDHPPAYPVEGRFTPDFTFSRELSASGDVGFSSLATFAVGEMTLENGDGGLDDYLDLYAVQGREIRVSVGAWDDVVSRRPAPGGTAFAWQDTTPGGSSSVLWMDSSPGGSSSILWIDGSAAVAAPGPVASGAPVLSSFRRLLRARVTSWSFSGGRIVIRIEPDSRRLDNPIQTATYDGSGGLGGTADLAGVTKPVALGICKGIEPKLVDPVLLTYHVNDGPIHGISDVRDEGISLSLVADYDSYDLLAAAVQQSLILDQVSYDIGIGQFATCLAEGAFRLGAPAAGRVIVDVQGSSFAQAIEVPWASGSFWRSGAGWRTLGFQSTIEVPWASGSFWASGSGWTTRGAPPFFSGARHMSQRLLTEQCGFDGSEVDSEGIDHLNGRDPDGSLDPSCGLWLPPGGSMSGREALSRLCQSSGVVAFQDRSVVWRMKYLEIPSQPAALVLDESMLVPGSLQRLDLPWPAPWSSWKCAYARNWTPVTASDLAGGDQAVTFVDPNVRSFSLRAAAYAEASDSDLAALYPQQRTGTLEALLTDEIDAELRASQLLGIYGGGQGLYSARWEGLMGRLEFMDAVTVRLPRLGMRAGRTFLVVGLTEEAPTRRVTTLLYGGGQATTARPVPSVRIASGPSTIAVSTGAAVTTSFDVALSAAGDRDAAVLWSLSGVVAADLQSGLSGQLVIPPGQLHATVGVAFAPQALTGDKTAFFSIQPLRGAAAGIPLSFPFRMLANSAPTPAVFIGQGFVSVQPSSAHSVTAQATVSLSAAAASPATVTWTVTGLTSTDSPGPFSGTATIAAGRVSTTISLTFAAQVLTSDKIGALTLSSPQGCTLGSPSAAGFILVANSVATVTPAASVVSGPGSIEPVASNTKVGTAKLALSVSSSSPASVRWTITGLAAADMANGALTGTATFPAGSTAIDLPLTFSAETLSADKPATLTISAPSGCTIGTPASASFTLLQSSTPVSWPYPKSAAVTAITLDWTKFNLLAVDSDNWVSTWAQDDRALATWGDGSGFGGGRVSIGLASITGTQAGALGGTRILGGGTGASVAACFPNPAGSGYPLDPNTGGPCLNVGLNGKSYGPLAYNTNLYLWISPGHVPGSYAEAKLFKSTLTGLGTWTPAAWELTNSTGWVGTHPTFLQAGKNYADRFDAFFYVAVNGWAPVLAQPATTEMRPGDLYLMRCPITSDPMAQGSWQWFTGTAASPTWGTYASRKAVWHDAGSTQWVCTMFYDKAIDRCILAIGWGAWSAGQLGFYEAQRPWGPWGTIDRFAIVDPSGRFDPSIFVASCLTRGLSVDGKSFPLLMSGSGTADALVAVQATLTTATGGPTGGTPVASLSAGFGTVTPSASAPTTASATVAASPAPSTAASVHWAITGLAASDVTGGTLSGTLTIPIGATSTQLTVSFTAQALAADKAGTLTLSAPSGCTLGSTISAGFTLKSNTVVSTAKHVALTGSDSTGTGTATSPWRTIAHALSGRSAGDTIYVHDGDYREAPLNISVNGTSGSPITIAAYPGETPTLNANLAAYETAGNSAWVLHDATTNTYKTATTIASGTYSVTLDVAGTSYALNRYPSLAWLMSTNYVYSNNPNNYYRGPGFFYNGSDNKLYVRLENLTGARAVDLDQGNSAIAPGFDFAIPPTPDPRSYVIHASNVSDVINYTGSNVVWDGIEVRGGDRSFTGTGSSLLVKNAVVVGHRVGANLSGSAHGWKFLQCPRMDSGFFSPWAPWAEIKTSQEATDQKRSICTESGTNFDIKFEQCRFGRYFDGFTSSGHTLYITNCDAEYILDDGMQCDTDAYDVQFCRNYWRGPILTDNGATPQTVSLGSKYVVGNIIDNQRNQPGYQPEFYCRPSHPSASSHLTWRKAHSTVVSHSDPSNAGVNPKRYAQNTFIYWVNDNGHGCGIQREQRGAGVQESYNNIILAMDGTKGVDGGDTRDGGEIRDGNVWWQTQRTGRESLFTQLASTGNSGGASYASLAAFRSSAAFTESKGYYSPGWEANSVEADPLIVSVANGDFRLQSGSPARTGFLDLSAKGWPFLEPGTHAGAVAPGATDPKGTCGATYFR